jgi:cytochrome c-type biogenesis protein CcmH/NrfG
VILSALVMLGIVLAPLLRASANASLGHGLERDDPVHRWQEARDRLIAQLRDNDLAMAEGRIDAATHTDIAIRLRADAEDAQAALRGARAAFAQPGADDPASRPGLAGSAFAALAIVAMTLGADRLASRADIDLRGTPHADGRVPLEAGAGARAPVIGADGVPDVGAMVARLEARIAEGGATAEDYHMLFRSYATMERNDAALRLLDEARRAYPDDIEFPMIFLRAAVSMPDSGRDADALRTAETMIAGDPALMEARWYRAVLLVRSGQADAARRELEWMAPRLEAGSAARTAVFDLIAQINADAQAGK